MNKKKNLREKKKQTPGTIPRAISNTRNSLVMFSLNSLTSGFSRVSCFTTQAYIVFRSASSGMNTSWLRPSYKPSFVWFVWEFWGALISLPARVQENVMFGGLKPFAQHSTALSRPNTTSEEGTNMDGGAVNEEWDLGKHEYCTFMYLSNQPF